MARLRRYRTSRARLGLAVGAVLVGGMACDGRPAAPPTRLAPAPQPADPPEVGDRTTFVGTITDIDPSNTFHPFLKWAVIVRVDEVVSGPRPGDSSWFAIHSRSEEGLKAGRRLKIRARKTAEGCMFRSYAPVGS